AARWPPRPARSWAASAPAAVRATDWATAARPRCPPAHSAERWWFPAAAPMAATAPLPAAARPAPAADDWAPAAGGPAAIPALPRRRPAAAAAGPAGHEEHCPADAAPDRKTHCRAARAPEARLRGLRRRSGPQTRSGQWFETSGAATLKANQALDSVSEIGRPLSAARNGTG